jgi:hypothetical protein
MDKKTNKPLTDENGKETISEVTFRAESTDGDIEVPFRVNTKKLNGVNH